MAVVLVKDAVTSENLKAAQEDYGDYVKIVADIDSGVMAIGGQWHADAERILLEQGSRQDNLWGGGIDLATHAIQTAALINIRPRSNNDSMEILDPLIRDKFISLVKTKFKL